MNKKEIEELRDPEAWDLEHAERVGPRKATRVVVSVAFRRRDFEVLAQAAGRRGKKVSEYIREAALTGIAADETKPILMGTGVTKGTIVFSAGSMGAGTFVYGPEIRINSPYEEGAVLVP